MRKICLAALLSFFAFAYSNYTYDLGYSMTVPAHMAYVGTSWCSSAQTADGNIYATLSFSCNGCNSNTSYISPNVFDVTLRWGSNGAGWQETKISIPSGCGFFPSNLPYSISVPWDYCEYIQTGTVGGNVPATTHIANFVLTCNFDFCGSGSETELAVLACSSGDSCDLNQVATNDSAFITGSNGRYQLFQLPDCEKTVIPVPSTSHVPNCNNMDCLNVAVSLDENFNFSGDGWSTNATQAIWVDPQNLECADDNSEGYFVFCSQNTGGIWDNAAETGQLNETGGGTITSGGLDSDGNRLPPDRVDTVTFVPSTNSPTESNLSNLLGALGQTVQNGFNNTLSAINNLGQTIQNGFNSLQNTTGNIFDWLVNFGSDGNPQIDISLDDSEYNYDGIALDSLILDTIPPVLDSSMWDFEFNLDSIIPEVEEKIKKYFDTTQFSIDMLDTLLPEKPTKEEITEQIVEKIQDKFDDILEKVSDGLAPLNNLISGDGGSCNCLTDSFVGLSFSVGKTSVNVSAFPSLLVLICDNIQVIRIIVLLIVAVGNIGLVLYVLRS